MVNRRTISIPDSLNQSMKEFEDAGNDVNWSAIAQHAYYMFLVGRGVKVSEKCTQEILVTIGKHLYGQTNANDSG